MFTGQNLPPPLPRKEERPERVGMGAESGVVGNCQEAGEGFTLPAVQRSEPPSEQRFPHAEQA